METTNQRKLVGCLMKYLMLKLILVFSIFFFSSTNFNAQNSFFHNYKGAVVLTVGTGLSIAPWERSNMEVSPKLTIMHPFPNFQIFNLRKEKLYSYGIEYSRFLIDEGTLGEQTDLSFGTFNQLSYFSLFGLSHEDLASYGIIHKIGSGVGDFSWKIDNNNYSAENKYAINNALGIYVGGKFIENNTGLLLYFTINHHLQYFTNYKVNEVTNRNKGNWVSFVGFTIAIHFGYSFKYS